MNSNKFKTQLKSIKESLRGQSVRVTLNGVTRRYNTLKDLGSRILELESRGCTFSFYQGDITRIIANNGIKMGKVIEAFGTNV